MLKKTAFLLGFWLTSTVIAEEAEYEIIDLAELNPTNFIGYDSYNWEQLSSIYKPFNEATEFAPFFNHLKINYQIDVAIETGTWEAKTTTFLGFLFKEVHSIEINKDFYKNSLKKIKQYPNIQLHHGSSPQVLQKLLPKLTKKRILFYLDAHWYADWPLLNELESINKTHRDNCIIVIDDFKVPNRNDIPFDSYQDNSCSFEFIQNQLEKIFSSYVYYYVLPKKSTSRAKFVAIPKEWAEKSQNY